MIRKYLQYLYNWYKNYGFSFYRSVYPDCVQWGQDAAPICVDFVKSYSQFKKAELERLMFVNAAVTKMRAARQASHADYLWRFLLDIPQITFNTKG